MATIKAKLGEPIETFFRRVVEYARATNTPLSAQHNGLLFAISPTANADDLIDDWWRNYGN